MLVLVDCVVLLARLDESKGVKVVIFVALQALDVLDGHLHVYLSCNPLRLSCLSRRSFGPPLLPSRREDLDLHLVGCLQTGLEVMVASTLGVEAD